MPVESCGGGFQDDGFKIKILCWRQKITQNTEYLQVYCVVSSSTEHTRISGATVGVFTRLRAVWPRNRVRLPGKATDCVFSKPPSRNRVRLPGKGRNFIFSKPPRQALGPARPFLQFILYRRRWVVKLATHLEQYWRQDSVEPSLNLPSHYYRRYVCLLGDSVGGLVYNWTSLCSVCVNSTCWHFIRGKEFT